MGGEDGGEGLSSLFASSVIHSLRNYTLFFSSDFGLLYFLFVRVGVGLFLVRTSYAFVEGRHYCLVHCLGEAKRERKNYCDFFHTVLRETKIKHNYAFSLRDSNLY